MGVVRAMESQKTDADKPIAEVKIEDCGELQADEGDGIPPPSDGDIYEYSPSDAAEGDFKDTAALSIKEIANNLFKNKEYRKALEKYEKSIRYIDSGLPTQQSDWDSEELKTTILLNQAICLSILGSEAAEIIQLCNRVLDFELISTPQKVKALYRRAVALSRGKNFEESLEDIISAQEIQPENAFLSKELSRIKQMEKKYLENERKMHKRMFN